MSKLRFYNNDCLISMNEIHDKSIDMILADLPYGTTACKWDTIIPFNPLWAQYKRIIKENGAIVLTASQPFTSALIMSNPDMFKYEWIWEKNTGSNFAQLKRMPFKQHENVLVFGNKGWSNYYPQMQLKSDSSISRLKYDMKHAISGDTESNKHRRNYSEKMMKSKYRYPSTVQKFNREMGLHPTQKPVTLFEYLIATYTKENETVLDNTMGSGTTGVACVNLNRNFYGIEKDEGYFKIAVDRILKAESKLADKPKARWQINLWDNAEK